LVRQWISVALVRRREWVLWKPEHSLIRRGSVAMEWREDIMVCLHHARLLLSRAPVREVA
jgi:hypothetical protein